jgi:hypothetical protein
MITEKQQNKIVKKALGNIKGQLFIAVVTETPHPKEAIEVEVEGSKYFVTLSYGDFAVIYLN